VLLNVDGAPSIMRNPERLASISEQPGERSRWLRIARRAAPDVSVAALLQSTDQKRLTSWTRDGFIEPTMAGVERAADLAAFADRFRELYDGDADAILFGNARRVIRRAFELRAR